MIKLSEEQLQIKDRVISSQGCFFITGQAGSGKTVLQRELIGYFENKGGVVVLAPTGAAALSIGGKTIHSWMGIGATNDFSKMNLKPGPWKEAKVILIDEISMVSKDLLSVMDKAARRFRGKPEEPFGGLKVIVFGDFLQLRPVNGEFCFVSDVWKEAFLPQNCFELKHCFRQGGDAEYSKILSRIRVGDVDSKLVSTLMDLKPVEGRGIEPTRLYSTNERVDQENMDHLQILEGEMVQFGAQDWGSERHLKNVSSWSNGPQTLKLKINAQVVLLRNIDFNAGLVNGSRGVVVGFNNDGGPVVRFINGATRYIQRCAWTLEEHGVTLATRQQFPLNLAWALTIHKSQGMTLDCVHVDLSNCRQPGMAYVALSRCKTMASLTVSGLTVGSVCVDQKALQFYSGNTMEPLSKKNRK